jgi:hypothetical protein
MHPHRRPSAAPPSPGREECWGGRDDFWAKHDARPPLGASEKGRFTLVYGCSKNTRITAIYCHNLLYSSVHIWRRHSIRMSKRHGRIGSDLGVLRRLQNLVAVIGPNCHHQIRLLFTMCGAWAAVICTADLHDMPFHNVNSSRALVGGPRLTPCDTRGSRLGDPGAYAAGLRDAALFEGSRWRAGGSRLGDPGACAAGLRGRPLRGLASESRGSHLGDPGAYAMRFLFDGSHGRAAARALEHLRLTPPGSSRWSSAGQKATRFIKISAEQRGHYLCATTAPPPNSIRSSELLRFCSCSGYTCATLKSNRCKGMAQMMGGAGQKSFFRSDLHRYTVC